MKRNTSKKEKKNHSTHMHIRSNIENIIRTLEWENGTNGKETKIKHTHYTEYSYIFI